MKSDIYFIKGICEQLFEFVGIQGINFRNGETVGSIKAYSDEQHLATVLEVSTEQLKKFSIKQPVYFANIFWDTVLELSKKNEIQYKEIVKYPIAHRDLSLVVGKDIMYNQIEETASRAGIKKLTSIRLFDIFESDKLGMGKKSFAINFTFSDYEKTLTDSEIDIMINKLITAFEKDLGAVIRKA